MGHGASSEFSVSKKETKDWKKKYGIPKDKVTRTFEAFKKQANSEGQITKDKFITVMQEEGQADHEFAEAVFDSFDVDRNGTIDIREYMSLMGVVFGGSLEDKLEASFKLFDEDHNGALDKEEVERMLVMVTKSVIRRRFSSTDAMGEDVEIGDKNREQLRRIVDEIFDKIDADRSGGIDLDEFKAGFATHPDICQFFKQF